MLRLITLALMLSLPGIDQAEITAATLEHDLRLADTQEMSAEDAIHFSLAAGFVQGAAEMGNRDLLFCLPRNVSNVQLLSVVRDFPLESEARVDDSAIDLVKASLMSAFPCRSRNQ